MNHYDLNILARLEVHDVFMLQIYRDGLSDMEKYFMSDESFRCWPDYVVAPLAFFNAAVRFCREREMDELGRNDARRLASLWAFKERGAVFRLDDHLVRLLMDSDPGHLPMQTLLNLRGSLYVSLDRKYLFERRLHGFYVSMDWEVVKSVPRVRFLLDMDGALLPLSFRLLGNTIGEVLEQCDLIEFDEGVTSSFLDIGGSEQWMLELHQLGRSMIALVLYILQDFKSGSSTSGELSVQHLSFYPALTGGEGSAELPSSSRWIFLPDHFNRGMPKALFLQRDQSQAKDFSGLQRERLLKRWQKERV